MRRVATQASGWFPVGIPLSGIGPMFEGIKKMALEAGRDPSGLELIVRANVELHDTFIEKDRIDFTGTLEQIVEDVTMARKSARRRSSLTCSFLPASRRRNILSLGWKSSGG